MVTLFPWRKKRVNARDEQQRELFIKKFNAFRELLRTNNKVLMTLADLQEKAGGDFLFDPAYLRVQCRSLSADLKKIISGLNRLADNRYHDLVSPYTRIDRRLDDILSSKVTIPTTDYVIPLNQLNRDHLSAAGGKMAYLGELKNRLELPVPRGFVITTHAYRTFMEHNRIADVVTSEMEGAAHKDFPAMQKMSAAIRGLIAKGKLPDAVQEAITKAYHELGLRAGVSEPNVAVRSSAIHEDVTASFAGQYETMLNVSGDDLCDRYKAVIAGQFTSRALFYYLHKGFQIPEMAMAVGVVVMVPAKSSGIVYTHAAVGGQSTFDQDPFEAEMLISAVWGLGLYAVDGRVTSHTYHVTRDAPHQIRHQQGGVQKAMLACNRESGTQPAAVPADRLNVPPLNDGQVRLLAELALKTERHFGLPQDIEWALDESDRLYLLQARQLRGAISALQTVPKPVIGGSGHKVLLEKGTVASRGVAHGRVRVMNHERELADFKAGDVLVVKHTYPEYAAVMSKAAAVVADIGNSLGHLATVAREFGVPAVFGTQKATRVLADRSRVTVDAVHAVVYDGQVAELLSVEKQITATPVSEPPAPVVRQLQKVLQQVAPLNLTDPQAANFRPRDCRTFHDIVRFAHEMALKEMFDLGRKAAFSGHSARQLVGQVPMQWWVIDLGNGVTAEAGSKKIRPNEITSVPMQALWTGMTAVAWQGPPPVDAKGFMSVVFSATTDPSIVPSVGKGFATKNYIIVAPKFCNLSCRLGFHFSTTEAYVGPDPNENYILFMFKGGAAHLERRVRRVRFLARILAEFDFRVEVKADAVTARLERFQADHTLERLKLVGHLIIHARQLDMGMSDDDRMNAYYTDLKHQIRGFVSS